MPDPKELTHMSYDTRKLVSLTVLGDAARRLEEAHSLIGQPAVPLMTGDRPFLGREDTLRGMLEKAGLHLLVGDDGRMFVSIKPGLSPDELSDCT